MVRYRSSFNRPTTIASQAAIVASCISIDYLFAAPSGHAYVVSGLERPCCQVCRSVFLQAFGVLNEYIRLAFQAVLKAADLRFEGRIGKFTMMNFCRHRK